ncbi:amino acid permease family protein, partial [mine drainage metagenome]
LVHLSHLSHGELVGRIWSWIIFLAYVTVPPVEVIAVLSYANNYIPGLVSGPHHLLTEWGYASAIGLLALIVAMNFLAIRWVLFINSTATWWKIGIAVFTIAILLILHFHPGNLALAPATIPRDGLFTSVATAGIIFSFLGFRQAIDLAGETRDPRRNIPFAVVGS